MLAEIAGLFFGLMIATAKVGVVGVAVLNPFDGITVQDVEVAYKKFCEEDLGGKWEPKVAPADSCPGGKWSKVLVWPSPAK